MKAIWLSLFYVFVVFSVSKFIFDPARLYHELWWLDIPMHILGGVGIALLAYYIFEYKKKNHSFLIIFVAYAVVAVVWEMYEVIHDILLGSDLNGWVDTVADFVNGAIGAFVAYLFVKK